MLFEGWGVRVLVLDGLSHLDHHHTSNKLLSIGRFKTHQNITDVRNQMSDYDSLDGSVVVETFCQDIVSYAQNLIARVSDLTNILSFSLNL